MFCCRKPEGSASLLMSLGTDSKAERSLWPAQPLLNSKFKGLSRLRTPRPWLGNPHPLQEDIAVQVGSFAPKHEELLHCLEMPSLRPWGGICTASSCSSCWEPCHLAQTLHHHCHLGKVAMKVLPAAGSHKHPHSYMGQGQSKVPNSRKSTFFRLRLNTEPGWVQLHPSHHKP